jgi:hypothetical protein
LNTASTGYAVWLKPFVLLVSVTCQGDGENASVEEEHLEKE